MPSWMQSRRRLPPSVLRRAVLQRVRPPGKHRSAPPRQSMPALRRGGRSRMAEAPVMTDPFIQASDRLKTLSKVMSTRAAIAQTPKELVWTLNKAKLYRYVSVVPAEKRHPVPLLLVFALMNRPYILDLRPGHSFVEFMVNQGYDLYLLDWGSPGPEDKNLKFDDYTLDYMPRAIRKVKAISGSDEFSLLGWCIGAILASIYSALRS